MNTKKLILIVSILFLSSTATYTGSKSVRRKAFTAAAKYLSNPKGAKRKHYWWCQPKTISERAHSALLETISVIGLEAIGIPSLSSHTNPRTCICSKNRLK